VGFGYGGYNPWYYGGGYYPSYYDYGYYGDPYYGYNGDPYYGYDPYAYGAYPNDPYGYYAAPVRSARGVAMNYRGRPAYVRAPARRAYAPARVVVADGQWQRFGGR
jgi:hypothetical protein